MDLDTIVFWKDYFNLISIPKGWQRKKQEKKKKKIEGWEARNQIITFSLFFFLILTLLIGPINNLFPASLIYSIGGIILETALLIIVFSKELPNFFTRFRSFIPKKSGLSKSEAREYYNYFNLGLFFSLVVTVLLASYPINLYTINTVNELISNLQDIATALIIFSSIIVLVVSIITREEMRHISIILKKINVLVFAGILSSFTSLVVIPFWVQDSSSLYTAIFILKISIILNFVSFSSVLFLYNLIFIPSRKRNYLRKQK